MLELHSGLIFWTIVIFISLVLTLRKLAWKPILAALDERSRKIKDSLEKAEEAQKNAERIRGEYENMIAQARRESQDLIAKGRKTAEATGAEIIQKAQGEAELLIQRAKREISLEREKALEEIKRTAGDLSISVAAKIIGKSLNAKDHQELIRQALQEIRPLVDEPN